MNVTMIAKTFQVWAEEENGEPDYEMLFTDGDGGYIEIGLSEELFQRIQKWLMTFPSKMSKVNAELSGENRT